MLSCLLSANVMNTYCSQCRVVVTWGGCGKRAPMYTVPVTSLFREWCFWSLSWTQVLPLWPLAFQTSLPTPCKSSSNCAILSLQKAPIPSTCYENPVTCQTLPKSVGYFPSCPLVVDEQAPVSFYKPPCLFWCSLLIPLTYQKAQSWVFLMYPCSGHGNQFQLH